MTVEFTRRQMARSVLAGGAATLLTAAPVPAQPVDSRTWLDGRQFGAQGDGKTEDTTALQKALDAAGAVSGGVFLPPGIYLTRELHLRAGTALVGVPAWNYHGPGGSTLRMAAADSFCLLNLTEAHGGTVEGVALDGVKLGGAVHGIATRRDKWGPNEDSFRIERCQVAHFSGDAVHLECAWCFSVRHCEFIYNGGDGLSLRGWDGFLIDNWFSGNGRAGFAARQENASVTFTANRVEWNGEENFVVHGGDGYQVTGNFFDRAGTVGVALRKRNHGCTQFTLTGNFIKRSGKNAKPSTHDSTQLLLDGAEGVTCIGNTLQAGRDDGPRGQWSPSYGIVAQGLRNCVVRENVLHDGAIAQLIVDLGGHNEGVLIGDNPGRLFKDFNRVW